MSHRPQHFEDALCNCICTSFTASFHDLCLSVPGLEKEAKMHPFTRHPSPRPEMTSRSKTRLVPKRFNEGLFLRGTYVEFGIFLLLVGASGAWRETCLLEGLLGAVVQGSIASTSGIDNVGRIDLCKLLFVLNELGELCKTAYKTCQYQMSWSSSAHGGGVCKIRYSPRHRRC